MAFPNIVLMKCADILVDRLWFIYSTILEKELCYDPWKQFTTVVLRKPGKPRYDVPKAYHLIALLNTMGKLLTAIISEQLTCYMEKYSLLPPTHFGGRPGRTMTDALHTLLYRIKEACKKCPVVSVLFLNIEGAFPNAVNEQLIHNLKMRKVPTNLVKFIHNLLKERSTTLKFDDFISERIVLDNRIGQGGPLSMILYQYYNADILDVPSGDHKLALAYVDNTILVAMAKDFTKTHNTLENMMNRAGGAVDWSTKHNSKFEFSKLTLIDFTHWEKQKGLPQLGTIRHHHYTNAEHQVSGGIPRPAPLLEHSHRARLKERSRLELANQKSCHTIVGTHTKTHPQNVHKCSTPKDSICGGCVGNPQALRGSNGQQEKYKRNSHETNKYTNGRSFSSHGRSKDNPN